MVATELKRLRPKIHLVYIGQKGDKSASILQGSSLIDDFYWINAGKFRRYHGEGISQVFNVKTAARNLGDGFRVIGGVSQAFRILGRLKPAAVFTPGGYVGVPVGMAAAKRKIPLITHDLDAHPGLANRINATWAKVHAVGMPKELYPYPQAKTVYVGVPIREEFQPVTQKLQQSYRRETGLDKYTELLFVVGGGLGAQRINEAMVNIAGPLLEERPGLGIVHGTGPTDEKATHTAYRQSLRPGVVDRVHVRGFIDDLYKYSAAADLIITRAGASSLAEFAAQHKACIVIPNPLLSGGHQLKNVEPLSEAGAVRVVTEEQMADGDSLRTAILELLTNAQARQELEAKFGSYAKPSAGKELAGVILNAANAT